MQPAEQDVKMRLLQAAKKLFARQGFDRTTVRQICEEAGANVALVSYYFGGKDKMFQALLDTFFTHPVQRHLLDVPMEPVAGLRRIIREVVLFQQREPDLIRVFHREVLMGSSRSDILRQGKLPLWVKIRELLEQGRARGDFAFDSLDLAFTFMMSVLLNHHAQYLKPMMTEGEQPPERLIEEMTAFILAGLRCRSD